MSLSIELTVNGRSAPLALDDDTRTLLDVLRADLGLKGPKYGCGLAQCGSCTVLIEGAPARACVMRAAKVDGARITTLEGLAEEGRLHPVQQAFVEKSGAQCGYCLNGMIMTAVALLKDNPDPNEGEIRDALRHNLCRCGTHNEIVQSVLHAARLASKGSDDGARA